MTDIEKAFYILQFIFCIAVVAFLLVYDVPPPRWLKDGNLIPTTHLMKAPDRGAFLLSKDRNPLETKTPRRSTVSQVQDYYDQITTYGEGGYIDE